MYLQKETRLVIIQRCTFNCLFCWGLTSQSTIFQSCRDGATTSWVINQYFWGVKCLAQGHNTAAVGFEPPTSRSGVRHSTTEPPRSPMHIQVTGLGYPSKQEVNDWNQRRRQERPSNAIGCQCFMCTFWIHSSPCFSHQKSERRTPNPVIMHESVVRTSENQKMLRVLHKGVWSFWKTLLKYGNVIKEPPA